jgi:hypothetical protein
MSEDTLTLSFSRRKSYDKSLRKLLQLGLIENISENEVAVKSTWRMITDPIDFLTYIQATLRRIPRGI